MGWRLKMKRIIVWVYMLSRLDFQPFCESGFHPPPKVYCARRNAGAQNGWKSSQKTCYVIGLLQTRKVRFVSLGVMLGSYHLPKKLRTKSERRSRSFTQWSPSRTDHSAIVISFNSLDEQMRGPSYWKINSSLMENEDYVSAMNEKIPEWLAEFYEVIDKRVLWDLIKYRVRQAKRKKIKSKSW